MEQYTCAPCGIIFQRRRDLTNHLRRHITTRQCDLCPAFFNGDEDLRQHRHQALCRDAGTQTEPQSRANRRATSRATAATAQRDNSPVEMTRPVERGTTSRRREKVGERLGAPVAPPPRRERRRAGRQDTRVGRVSIPPPPRWQPLPGPPAPTPVQSVPSQIGSVTDPLGLMELDGLAPSTDITFV